MGFAQRAQRLNTNMITAELTEPVTRETKGTGIIRLPFGLLGFEHVKQYVLLTNPAEEPFMWFQMLDDAKRAFLVAPPARLVPDYEPDISEDEVDFLELADPSDAFLLNIVTLRGNAGDGEFERAGGDQPADADRQAGDFEQRGPILAPSSSGRFVKFSGALLLCSFYLANREKASSLTAGLW